MMRSFARFSCFSVIVLLLALVPGVAAQEVASDTVTKLDSFFNTLTDQNLFSGSVLVVVDGEILLNEGYGLANRDWDIPNTPETKYRVGSITKEFTSMSILLLQEQGKLSVHDTICTYIEDCPEAWAEITIEQLMTHTSGMNVFFDNAPQTFEMQPASIQKLMSMLREQPLQFAPGEGWLYSNSGYIVLGYIIKEVSGVSYQRFLQDNIFDPLGLENTGYEDNKRVLKNRAVGYIDNANIAQYIDMSVPYSAGAMYSTTGDLYTWITALMDGKVIDQPVLDAMWDAAVEIPNIPNQKYAYGLASYTLADHAAVGHGGSINGFRSTLNYFPDDKAAIIILSNRESANPDQLAASAAGILFGEE
jgi:CubicO group peptidase (beta-lactamase class C family)